VNSQRIQQPETIPTAANTHRSLAKIADGTTTHLGSASNFEDTIHPPSELINITVRGLNPADAQNYRVSRTLLVRSLKGCIQTQSGVPVEAIKLLFGHLGRPLCNESTLREEGIMGGSTIYQVEDLAARNSLVGRPIIIAFMVANCFRRVVSFTLSNTTTVDVVLGFYRDLENIETQLASDAVEGRSH
jgi:hypothetical protein